VDDRDLELLRAFRLDEAEPPPGLQERIEERLWQSILAEEAQSAAPRSRRRPWYADLLRPAVAAGAAATIAIGVAVGGGTDGSAGIGSGSSVSEAGVLDSTPAALFGGSNATSTSATPIAGAIDVSDSSQTDSTLMRGPVLDESGQLDDATLEVVSEIPRDPQQLQPRLLRGASQLAGAEQAERATFHIAMRWVTSPQVPGDLRAAMLRSLDGLQGVDPAIAGVDLLGRSGIVLGHLDQTTGLRSQYLLDPSGGMLLERRTITTGYLDPACPPGTYTSHELYSSDGQPITQGDAPWIDWPIVIAACDPALATG
jgi:hypothetical protein